MRVVYIWHAAVEREYRKLLWEMAKQGHEVHLVTAHRWTESSRDQRFEPATGDESLVAHPLRVMFRDHIRSFFFVNLWRMVSILLKVKPDVIYLKEEPYSIAAFQWVWLSSWLSPRCAIVIESDENMEGRHPFLYRWMEQFVFRRIRGIASVPTAGIDLYKKRGFQGAQYKTSYFVNTDVFRPVSASEARSVFPEIEDGVLSIGYVGRITPEKGLDTLVEAVAGLKAKGLHCRVYLLGRVAEGYGEVLREMMEHHQVQKDFVFLQARPMDKIVFFYNAIDVLVLPSKSTSWWIEQFGRVIVEAMACGTPVVGSSSGEIPIVIGDKRLVFREGNSGELAAILEKFLSGSWKKKDFHASVIQRTKEHFSLARVALAKLQIMEEVMKKND